MRCAGRVVEWQLGGQQRTCHRAGDGTTEHLGGDDFEETPTIELVNGLFEVGRAAPADIVIAVPSVSGRHAMLRVGVPPALARPVPVPVSDVL